MNAPGRPRRLGVLGGSFNPVHWGHLHIALLAREAARLDRVLFVPAACPPHKDGHDLAPDRDRLRMLRAALREEPGTAVSEVELQTGASSYTADTLDRIQEEYPGARLYFIMGMDSLQDLPGWHEPERILSRHRVIAVDRPGYDPGEVDPELASRCRLVRGNPLAIAATAVRARLGEGRSVRHLVPRAVERYIHEHGLYARAGASPEA